MTIASIVPVSTSSLVGRQPALQQARALLLDAAVPLLILTGPGGVGKTRLALAIMDEVGDDFADGSAFVDLSPLADPDRVLDALARALNLSADSRQPLLQRLCEHLHPCQMLIVLDNCEHVLDAAAALAARLAADCPAVQLVATSRAPLRLRSEQVLPVLPLAVPAATVCSCEDAGAPDRLTALRQVEAVTLFVHRGRQVRPDFGVTPQNAADVAEICRRLDGLPLAIELAAARLRHLSPAALLARLSDQLTFLTGGPRDVPFRQQALRDAIAWSYDLLPPHEQTLFRQLAVFSGGFTLEAAEFLGKGAASTAVHAAGLEGIASLIDMSLVTCDMNGDGTTRYRMLETIRAFGLEQLVACGEEPATRDRHARWCLALADRPWWDVPRVEVVEWLGRLDPEQDNLRASLGWLEQSQNADEMVRLAGLLSHFWMVRSQRMEGAAWLERALAVAATANTTPPELPYATYRASSLQRMLGRDERANELAEMALSQYRAGEDMRGMGATLNLLGALARGRKAYDRARAYGEEALVMWREVGDSSWIALALDYLALTLHWQGENDRAEALLMDALAIYQDTGDAWGLANVTNNLAYVAADRGDWQLAAARQLVSLDAGLESGIKEALFDILANIAVTAIGCHLYQAGVRVFAGAQGIVATLNYQIEAPEREWHEQAIATARAKLGEREFEAMRIAGAALSADEAVTEARRVLDAVRNGAKHLDVPAAANGLAVSMLFGLTKREHEILRLLAGRLTDPEIAKHLFVSPRTVEGHVAKILGKLGAGNRREAAALAVRHQLV